MKTFAKRIIVPLFIFLTLLLLTVLFVPAVSKFIIVQAAQHFLDHRLNIEAYHFNPTRLFLRGTFDDGTVVRIDSSRLLSSDRRIFIALRTELPFFDPLAGTHLPLLVFDANLTVEKQFAALRSRLLDGTADAQMNLETSAFTYALSGLHIEQYLRDNALPAYASGTLNAHGEGIAATPLKISLNMKSYNMTLLEPLVSMAGPQILPSNVTIDFSSHISTEDGHAFGGTLSLESELLDLHADDLHYDIDSGAYSLSVAAQNKTIAAVPVHQSALLGFGTYANGSLRGNFIVDVDNYQLKLTGLRHAFSEEDTKTDFLLSSKQEQPFNLTGRNVIGGTVALEHGELRADLGFGRMPSSIRLQAAGSKISIISNNIPLETLSSILNQPVAARGDLRLNGTIDTVDPFPTVDLDAAVETLHLSEAVAHTLQSSSPLSVRIRVSGENGQYKAETDAASADLGNGSVQAAFDAQANKAHIDGALHDLKLPWYQAPSVIFRSDADTAAMSLSHLSVTTPYEQLSIPFIGLKDDINGTFGFQIGHLERFVPKADANVTLRGKGTVQRMGSQTELEIATEGIGTLYALNDGPSTTVSLDEFRIEQLFKALGVPPTFTGNVSLAGQLDERSALFTVSSPKLIPVGGLESALRPFPLDASLNLSRCSDRFSGNVLIHTAYDSLSLTSIDLDLLQKKFASHYRVDFDNVGKSAIRLPAEYVGDKISFAGSAELLPQRQHVTLQTKELELSEQLHRTLDGNATGPMPTGMEVNATNEEGKIALSAAITTDPASLLPLQIRYDRKSTQLSISAELRRALFPGNASVRLDGRLENFTALRDGKLTVQNAAFDVNATSLHADPAVKDYGAVVVIGITPLHAVGTETAKALLQADVRTYPDFEAQMQTTAFDGNLSAVMNEDMLVVHATEVNLPRILRFARQAEMVKDGTFSIDAIIDSPALLEGNLSKLTGGVDLRLENVLIGGFKLDDYLDTLRDTQDLSLFQGSLTDLPIIRTVTKLPGELSRESPLQTSLPRARFATAVKNGILVCDDCAAATLKNRVAFAGNVDLPKQRFDSFYVALLKPSGCPYFMQEVKGTLEDPQLNLAASGIKVIGGSVVSLASNVTEAADWLTGLLQKLTKATGEVVSIVPVAGKAADITLNSVSGTLHSTTTSVSECTPFYIGTVPHPAKAQK